MVKATKPTVQTLRRMVALGEADRIVMDERLNDAKKLARLMQAFLKKAPPTDIKAEALELCERILRANP